VAKTPVTIEQPLPGIFEEIEAIGSTHDLESLFGQDNRPKKVWIISYSNGTHGVYVFKDVHGLAACAKKRNLETILHMIKTNVNVMHKMEQVEFEEALELAKTKQAPIRAVLVLDSLEDVGIYYTC